MRGHVLRVSLLTGFLLAAADAARAEVCVTIDLAHDTLSPRDQASALVLVTRQFEQAGEAVVPDRCPNAYSLSHVQLGTLIVVNLSGPGGRWEANARGLDDLPSVYSQMVRAVVAGRPMDMSVVDRTNVTAAQAISRRVHTDSLWYARLGYGSLFGDDAYGTPALGFGYRAELDAFAIDVSFLNFQIGSVNGYSPRATGSAGSLLKLSGLYFLNPTANRTAYFGAGVSYGHSRFGGAEYNYSTPDRYRTDWEGSGMQGELTVGYELARATSLRLFLQADAVLPFYQVAAETFWNRGLNTTTDRRYAPSLIVSVGIGR